MLFLELQRATESVAALNATIVAKDSEIDEMKKQNSELMSVVNNLKAAIETHEKQLVMIMIENRNQIILTTGNIFLIFRQHLRSLTMRVYNRIEMQMIKERSDLKKKF